MPGLGETLTEKAGPLPTWAWAGLGTTVLGGYLIYRKKQQTNAAQAAAAGNSVSSNLGTTPVSNLTTEAEPMPIQMGDTFVNVSDTGDSTPGPTGPTGPAGPPGKPGPAGPKGSVPPPAAPKPTPTKPKPAQPAPKPATTYTVKSGDTLWGIATHYYGNGALWPTIYNANKAIIGANPNLIRPGQKFVIPPKP